MRKQASLVMTVALVLPTLALGLGTATAPPGVAGAPGGEPIYIDGDWDVLGNVSLRNATYILRGNLTVHSNAELVLRNVTMLFDCFEDGAYHLEVDGGGALRLLDLDGSSATRLDAPRLGSNTTHPFAAYARRNSLLELHNAAVERCGYGPGGYGLAVETDNATIEGTAFVNCYDGLYISGASPRVANSSFASCFCPMQFYNSNALVANCSATAVGGYVARLQSSDPTIQGLRADGALNGLHLSASDPEITGLALLNTTGCGLNCYASSPTLFDSSLGGWLHVSASGGAHPGLVNTTFNASLVSVERGSWISRGGYISVLATNSSGEPWTGASVVVLDSGSMPSFQGSAGADGSLPKAVVRDGLITSNGTLPRTPGTVLAYAIGANGTVAGGTPALPSTHVWLNSSGEVSYAAGGLTYDFDATVEGGTHVLDGNLSIFYGASLALRNATIVFAGCEGIPTGILLADGALDARGCTFASGMAPRAMQAGPFTCQLDPATLPTFEGCRFECASEVLGYSGALSMSNCTFAHAAAYAVHIAGPDAGLRGLHVDDSAGGVYVDAGSARIDGLVVQGLSGSAINLRMGWASVSGMDVKRAAYGALLSDSALYLNLSTLTGLPYGVYCGGASRFEPKDCSFSGIAGAAVSVQRYSSSRLEGVAVSSSSVAVDTYATNVWLEGCTLENNQCGVSTHYAHPVVANSTLSNAQDLRLSRGSFPSVLASSFNESRCLVPDSSYVSVGGFFQALVTSNGTPVDGVLVSAQGGYSSGTTGPYGGPASLAYEDRILTSTGSEARGPPEVVAVQYTDGSRIASGFLNLSAGPGITIELPPKDNCVVWAADREVRADESHTGEELVVMADVLVLDGATLSLDNCTVRFAGTPALSYGIAAVLGTVTVAGSRCAAMRARSPGIRWGGSFWVGEGSSLSIEGTGLVWPSPIRVYGGLELANSTFAHSTVDAIDSFEGDVRARNISVSWFGYGLVDYDGTLELANASVERCAYSALYASGTFLDVRNLTATRNELGAELFSGASGALRNSAFERNDIGVQASSVVFLDGLRAENNTWSGVQLVGADAPVRGLYSANNQYGLYLDDCAPPVQGLRTRSNDYGLYCSRAAPLLDGARLDGDGCGIYSGGRYIKTQRTFDSGLEDAIDTFIGAGSRAKSSFSVPVRARLLNASMTVTGVQLRNVPVTSDPTAQMNPAIWGDLVAYADRSGGTWNIRLYDLTVDSDGDGIFNYMEYPHLSPDPAMVNITAEDTLNYDPEMWGDNIVWSRFSDATDFDVYAHSISNGTTWAVAATPEVDWQPAIDGETVTWTHLKNGIYEVFAGDVYGASSEVLSNSPKHSFNPDVWGDKVVWFEYIGEPGTEFADILMHNLTTGETTYLTNDTPQQYLPCVDGSLVAWHDDRKGDTNGDGYKEWDIYTLDLSTGTQTRITNDTEASFAPDIWGDKLVWYWHDRTGDVWSVKLHNLTTGETEVLERQTNGDSWPVAFGPRVAWLNKSVGSGDVCVYDQRYVHYPSDPTVDVGDDGSVEFSAGGEFAGSEVLGPGILAPVVRARMRECESNATASLPIRTTSSSTGRLRLHPLSITYELQGLGVGVTISNSTSVGLDCADSDFRLVNCTLAAQVVGVRSAAGADPELLNCSVVGTFDFPDRYSNVTVRNFLHVEARELPDLPVPNATVRVADNGRLVAERTTDAQGEARWMRATDVRYNSTGAHENVTTVVVSNGAMVFEDNPRSVDMSASHWELFVTDATPPAHPFQWPSPGGRCNQANPIICVWVTDLSPLKNTSLRLYVDGYRVFYNYSAIQGGCNLSYFYEVGAVHGQVVRCRVVADDSFGNRLDFSWNFTVDLVRPAVVSVQPPDGSVGVGLQASLVVNFSEPMNRKSLEGALDISPATSGAITWNADNTTLVFTPLDWYLPGQVHTVTIGAAASDVAGNSLGTDYVWSFTTEADTFAPLNSREWPPSGGGSPTTYPTISLWVTDASGVVQSSIRLYVNGYSIAYDLVPVPKGFNVSYYHEEGFPVGSIVQCRIVALDPWGNRLDSNWSFTIVETFTIQLREGWNLVSTPLVPLDPSLSSVLASIAGMWDYALAYDPKSPSGPWLSNYTGRPWQMNDLDSVDCTMGLWLRTTAACNLTVQGLPPAKTTIQLMAGWNLVGYPARNDRTYTASDLRIDTGATFVQGFDPNAPYLLKELPCIYILRKGEAYWVFVPADSVWTVDW